MKQYSQLTLEQRYTIYSMLKTGPTQLKVAEAHKQAIVSMTERKSGLALIYKVNRRTKENTERAINRLLGSISDQVLTITSDNGKELVTMKSLQRDFNVTFNLPTPILLGKEGQMKIPMVLSDSTFQKIETLEP